MNLKDLTDIYNEIVMNHKILNDQFFYDVSSAYHLVFSIFDIQHNYTTYRLPYLVVFSYDTQ